MVVCTISPRRHLTVALWQDTCMAIDHLWREKVGYYRVCINYPIAQVWCIADAFVNTGSVYGLVVRSSVLREGVNH